MAKTSTPLLHQPASKSLSKSQGPSGVTLAIIRQFARAYAPMAIAGGIVLN